MTAPQITTAERPTPEQIAMAMFVQGNAANGEMVVSNGEIDCAGCQRTLLVGDPVFWSGDHCDCDPYCGPCTIKEAKDNEAFCDAIESGDYRP